MVNQGEYVGSKDKMAKKKMPPEHSSSRVALSKDRRGTPTSEGRSPFGSTRIELLVTAAANL